MSSVRTRANVDCVPLVIERVICKEASLHINLRDILMRGIVREAPRRVLLRAFSGIGLASLSTVLVASHDADARKRKRKKKCKGGTKKCGKTCIPQAACCSDADCPPNAPCQDGTCVCPNEGEVACGQTCVDLEIDGANCGACGHTCDTDECANGACTCSGVEDCPDGCLCTSRIQGGSACSSGFADQTCDTDEECPISSVCGAFVDLCTKPCLG